MVARSAHGGPFGIRFHPESARPCRFEHATRHPKEVKCMANVKRASQAFLFASVARKMKAMQNLKADPVECEPVI